MKLLMARRIVPLKQTFFLVLGVALGVASLLSVNSLFTNYQKGWELSLMGTNPLVLMTLQNDGPEGADIMTELQRHPQIEAVNQALIIRGKARTFRLDTVDGAFRYKREKDFVMYGIKLFDIGHYTSKVMDDSVESNTRQLFQIKIKEGLRAYKTQLDRIQGNTDLHDQLCSPPIGGQEYSAHDVERLIQKDLLEAQDVGLAKKMERCIAASMDFKHALNLAEGVDDLSHLPRLSYTKRQVLLNENFLHLMGGGLPGETLRVELKSITEGPPNLKLPERVYFEVAGSVEQALLGTDEATFILSLDKMIDFLGVPLKPNSILIKPQDPYASQELARQLRDKWTSGVIVTDWISENQSDLALLLFLKNLILIILSMIIVVSAFGISAQLYMTVFEKEKHIALLKAVGASSSDIMLIFLLYSGLVGVSGVALGLCGAFLTSFYASGLKNEFIFEYLNIDEFSVHISMADVGSIFVVVVFLCVLAAAIPAKKAADTNPITGLNLG